MRGRLGGGGAAMLVGMRLAAMSSRRMGRGAVWVLVGLTGCGGSGAADDSATGGRGGAGAMRAGDSLLGLLDRAVVSSYPASNLSADVAGLLAPGALLR